MRFVVPAAAAPPPPPPFPPRMPLFIAVLPAVRLPLPAYVLL